MPTVRLGAVIKELGHPRVLALTATASLPVREEILERLNMQNPRVVVQGFDRPNIWLGVETFYDEAEKKRALLERVSEANKPGIIYVATRKHAEEIAEALCERGVKAVFYHAGMKAKDREQAQEAFMQGKAEVIAATTAFGMGVNKENVRFVFHYDISDSVDSYYQEIGRAGRDGEEADAQDKPFPLNSHVKHTAWGEGVVTRYEGDKMVVLFDEVGYKTLSVDIITERGLLEPVQEG